MPNRPGTPPEKPARPTTPDALTGRGAHPFADRWNHSTHYFPRMASRIPASARRVLDVGCGEGTFARYVADAGRLVVGVDTDSAVLPRSSHGERFAVASAESLPFPDETFDAVTMTMVLHHLHVDRALGEAVRVLAPGGVLLILGYGRYGGLRDAAHELRDVLTHRLLSRKMNVWDPPTVRTDPPETWAGVRAATNRLLPGSRYRRLPLWRYLVEFDKPETART